MGQFTDGIYNYMQFTMSLKQSSLSKIDQIKKLFTSNPLRLVLYFEDSSLVYDNYTDPLDTFVNYHYTYLDLEFNKKTDLLLSNLDFYSDNNILWPSFEMTEVTILDSAYDYFHSVPERDQNMTESLQLASFYLKALK